MTNEELLSVAEIVERATNRFNAQAAYHRERFDEHVKLIASMKADHEAKMVEHRAAFGARTEADAKIIAGLRSEIGAAQMAVLERDSLISERDGLLTQVQDMRVEINRLQWENMTMHKDAEDGYTEAIKVLGDPIALSKERDALRAEVDAAWESATSASQSRSVAFPVRLDSNCEPCDPPNHDTEAGKAAAESAVKTEPVAEEIKVGDMAKVVGASGDLTAQSDIGKIGEVLKIVFGDGTVLLSGGAGWVDHRDVRKVTT